MKITPKTFTAARAFSRGNDTIEVGDELSGPLLQELLAYDAVGDEPKFVNGAPATKSTTNTTEEGSDNAVDRLTRALKGLRLTNRRTAIIPAE